MLPRKAGELQVTGQKIEKPSDVGSLTQQEQVVKQEQDLYAPQGDGPGHCGPEGQGACWSRGFSTAAIAEATAQVARSQETMLSRQETVCRPCRLW